MDEERIASQLRGSALFEHMDAGSVSHIARVLRKRRFRRNETIFHQGDPGDSCHVVHAGAVKIVLPSIDGDEAIIATLSVGDFFGELALLDGAPRSATAVATESTETWSLPKVAFDELLDRDRALRDALLAGMAAELRRLTRQVEELHFLDLAGRLAMRLARMARAADVGTTDVRLDWPYTQTDVASMIGGTRQSVNKLMAELVDRGLITLEKDALVVKDIDVLELDAVR